MWYYYAHVEHYNSFVFVSGLIPTLWSLMVNFCALSVTLLAMSFNAKNIHILLFYMRETNLIDESWLQLRCDL